MTFADRITAKLELAQALIDFANETHTASDKMYANLCVIENAIQHRLRNANVSDDQDAFEDGIDFSLTVLIHNTSEALKG